MSLDDLLDEFGQDPGDPWDWDKPSKAVIAQGKSNGVVLFCVGPHLELEIDSFSDNLEDLGLDNAPKGLSVWEGVYITRECGGYDCVEYDTEPKGKFREPTDEEWQAIRKGECPWDEKEYLREGEV